MYYTVFGVLDGTGQAAASRDEEIFVVTYLVDQSFDSSILSDFESVRAGDSTCSMRDTPP
jgi:hypothetical protein